MVWPVMHTTYLDLVILKILGATLLNVTARPQVPRPVPPRLAGPRLAPQVLARPRPRVPRARAGGQLPRGGARVAAVPARLQVLPPRDGGPRTQRLQQAQRVQRR